MKTMKKLLAITLSVAMIAGVFAVIDPEKAEAAMPTTEYFNETFSTDGAFDNEEWSSNSTNLETWKDAVSGGKLTIPSNNATAVYLMANDSAFMNLSDYTVSCDVTYSGVPTAETTNVVIAARTTNATNQGYAFQLTVSNKTEEDTVSTSVYVRLRDQKKNAYYTTSTYIDNFDFTRTHTLKLTCSGTIIKGYVDDQLMIAYNTLEHDTYANGETIENRYEAGTAALRMATTNAGVDVSFDNFKMERLAKFYDDFDGYDGDTTGEQKATALEANDWYVENEDNASLLTGEAYVVPSTNTTTPIVLQTENAEGALGWNDYSVEAEIKIGKLGEELTNTVYAAVTGRHTVTGGTDGYEIEFYHNANGNEALRIRKRGTTPETLESCSFEIAPGETYNLKAVFQGDTIYAYVNDVLYLECTDESYPIGFAGIRKMGAEAAVDVSFDNFVVYDYDVEMPAFSDDFNGYVPTEGTVGSGTGWSIVDLNAKGWQGSSNTVTRTYVPYFANGVLKLPTNVGSEMDIVLQKHSQASNWKNYTVECGITFNNNDDDATSGKYTYVMISGRETAVSGTGYGLVLGATYEGHLRYVYLYKDGELATAYAEDDVVSVSIASAQRPQAGTEIDAKLEFNGTQINGYINGEKMVSLTLESENDVVSGYAGIHTIIRGSSYDDCVDVTFDNFKVYDLDNPYIKEIIGDVKVDNIINATDVDAIRNRFLKDSLTADAIDVNKDGAKNIYDYVRLMRILDSMN